MKPVLLIQLFLTLMGSFLLAFYISTQGAISYAEGSFIVLLNLALLTWAWSKILSKKLVALATSLIVFKYAIFGFIIYRILTHPDTDQVWFGVGLSTLMATVLIFALGRLLRKE